MQLGGLIARQSVSRLLTVYSFGKIDPFRPKRILVELESERITVVIKLLFVATLE